ncbi:MAG TPA: PDZ domain-containing protein, partial [Candidatus Hydrogenedentes bacterium]|nr:PDZ domain-containing protein [Candidatus Hydrogenedentota bacterium]
KVNGEPTKTAAEVMRKIASYAPGTTVNVEVFRNGQALTIPVTLAERDVNAIAEMRGGSTSPDEEKLGLSVQNIDPGTRKNLGLDDAIQGVLVTDVDPAGPAAEARLEPGDIILEVGQQPVANAAEFWKRIGELKQPGKAVLLRIRRSNGNSEITIIRIPKE